MISDGEMLLQAILGNPGDDLARLAYADWCEEEGDDARAEFIRCQIGLFPKQDALAILQRTGEDWNHWSPRFLPSLPGVTYRLWQNRDQANRILSHEIGVQFHRGFVESVRCSLQSWLDHGKEIVQAHPVTRVEAIDYKAIRWRISDDKVMWMFPIGMPGTLIEILLEDPRRSTLYATIRFDTEDNANAAISRALLILAHGTCTKCQGRGEIFRERDPAKWARRSRTPLGEWVECETCWWAKT